MCRNSEFEINKTNLVNGNNNNDASVNSTRSPLPKVLEALMRLENQAENDYSIIQTSIEQMEKIENIMNKLVGTHFDSDNYVDYLFKRAEQLAGHLETYKNIVGKIEIGIDIRLQFKQISFEFIEYLQRKIDFKSVWLESMQVIESGRKTIQDKLIELKPIRESVEDCYNKQKYFELHDFKLKFDEELNNMNDLVDNCFKCGQHSKELSTILHDKLILLEANFQRVVKDTMNKINEIKSSSFKTSTTNSSTVSDITDENL